VARHRTRWIELLGISTLALPPVVVGVALVLFWNAAAGDRLGWSFAAASVAAISAFGAWRGRPFRPLPFLGRALVIAAVVTAVGGALKLLGADAWIVGAGIPLVVLALVARFVPFTVRLFRNGFLALDPEEEEAARLCGHRRLSRMLRVELPRMRGVVGGAAVMAYVLCFTELAATLMVLPAGWQSVQARIFNMVHYRSVGEVAALCVMVVAMAALPVILAGILSRRRWEVL
jgi:ABC-type Fe3+ transport system permease subunit